MKVSFLLPTMVKDYYGHSALTLLPKLAKFESVVNTCDETVDVVFSTSISCGDKVVKYRKRYPNKIFLNYFWDLPFWRAQDTRKRKYFHFLHTKSYRDHYLSYLRSGTLVLSSSQHTRNEVLRNYNIDSEALYLFFPNVDIDEMKPDTTERKNQIICVGRIEQFKRCDIIIRALSHLQNPPKLLLVGDGSEKDRCQKLAEEMNVKVEFRGWMPRQDTLKEIRSSLLSVNPSVMEGNCGWCPCEAVWSGIPAIMADIPETKEFFEDKGVYFHRDDHLSLSKEIDSMLSKSQDERDRIAAESKKRISFYSVQAGVTRVEEFIRDVQRYLKKHSISGGS